MSASSGIRMAPRLPYRPELDGLRGVAILLVFAQHAQIAGFNLAGWTGVTMFFTLSGFLITSLLLSEARTERRINLPRFYMRRALRLVPALLVVVAAVLILSMVIGPDMRLPAFAAVFYVSNWADIAGLPMGFLGHTWSLGIEEQFYLLWPLVLILIPNSRARLAACVIGVVGCLVIRFLVFDPAPDAIGRAYQGLDVRADALLLGCALALLGWSLPRWVGWVGVGCLVATVAVVQSKTSVIFVGIPLVAVGTAMIIGARTSVTARPLVALGGISYGFYLWHFPIIESTRGLASMVHPIVLVGGWLIASLLAAFLSRRLVELPALSLRDRPSLWGRRERDDHHAAGLRGDGHEQGVASDRDAGRAAVED